MWRMWVVITPEIQKKSTKILSENTKAALKSWNLNAQNYDTIPQINFSSFFYHYKIIITFL